jgi:hypothetical protein
VIIDWDEWRRNYDSMTYEQQQSFYSSVWQNHPIQQHYNADAAKAFFDLIDLIEEDLTIVEIGGWRGELAEAVLPDVRGFWLNIEICREAAEQRIPTSPRYKAYSPPDWPWDDPTSIFTLQRADVLVASHVIEHLSVPHLELLLDTSRARWMFLASPLPAIGPVDWTGYNGSHILPLGWDGVEALAGTHGWLMFNAVGDTRWFRRGHAPAGTVD